MVVDFPGGLGRIGRRSGRLHQPLGEIPLGGQQLLGEPKHVGSWSMRRHPTSAARCQTMPGPRWPTPPGSHGQRPDIAPGRRSRTIRWCSSDAPRSGSSDRDSRPARCSSGGPRGTAQHQALAPEQAAALRRRRERRTLAATLARSSVSCIVWAGVMPMTPPAGGSGAGTARRGALDRHSPAGRYARTARALLASQGGWPRSIHVTARSYALYHRCAARSATQKSAGEPTKCSSDGCTASKGFGRRKPASLFGMHSSGLGPKDE